MTETTNNIEQPLTPTVSIVVASHRPNHIGPCVESIANCAAADLKIKIIVVADYAIESINLPDSPFYTLTAIHHAQRSIPAKRNIGIKQAAAPMIGFTDDDCRVDKSWIKEALRFLAKNPACAGVEGRTLIANNAQVNAPVSQFKRLERQGFRTNNIFYRTEHLRACSGFDERFTVQREDVDLAYTLLEKGLQIGYHELMIVNHVLRHNERFDLLKNCWNRRFDPLLHAKHRVLYRRCIGTPWTLSIAVVGIMQVVTVVAMVLHAYGMIAGIIDIGLIFYFSLRRNGYSAGRMNQIIIDGFLYAVSPVVLAAALVWGIVRFKRVLLF